MMHKMPFLMEGLGDSEGDIKKSVRWSPYMEELDSSNLSSFELISKMFSFAIWHYRYYVLKVCKLAFYVFLWHYMHY